MKFLPAIKPTLIWLLPFTITLIRSNAVIEEAIEVFLLGKKVVNGVWKVVNQTYEISNGHEEKILMQMNAISEEIHSLENKVSAKSCPSQEKES
jgi:hypothetical protein